MKKGFLLLLAVMAICIEIKPVQAFIPLPPFKTDIANTARKAGTYVNSLSQKATKFVQESTIIQTSITYGKGAKEAYDYAMKMKNEFQGFELNKLGSIMDDMSSMEAEKSKTKEQAASEIAAKVKETNAKIVAIDDNNRELNKKIVSDPENAKKYQKQMQKNEKEKIKLSKDLVKETRQINRKTEKKIGAFNDKLNDLSNQASGLLSSIVSIPSNYDSAEDLQKTAKTLMPDKDTEVNTHVSATYAAIYRFKYYESMVSVLERTTLIKSNITEDNKKSSKNQISTAELESLGGAGGTLVKMKADNVQALLNFTELLLQRLKLDVAYELAKGNFNVVDPVQAAGDFNFDNYRFTAPTQAEFEAADAAKAVELKKLDSEITPSTEKVINDSRSNMFAPEEAKKDAEGNKDGGQEKSATTEQSGSGSNEKK